MHMHSFSMTFNLEMPFRFVSEEGLRLSVFLPLLDYRDPCFEWDIYLEDNGYLAAPEELFTSVSLWGVPNINVKELIIIVIDRLSR